MESIIKPVVGYMSGSGLMVWYNNLMYNIIIVL